MLARDGPGRQNGVVPLPRLPPSRLRWAGVAGIVAVILSGLVWLVCFLLTNELDVADQWASVLAVMVASVAAGVTVASRSITWARGPAADGEQPAARAHRQTGTAAAARPGGADPAGAGPGRPIAVIPDGRPQSRTPLVVGEIPREAPAYQVRSGSLKRLARAAPGRAAAVCAVIGARGVGKTQVAAAYARRCVDARWAVVAWMGGETTDQVVAGLARVADALGVYPQGEDSTTAARAALAHLQRLDGQSLLVFDNATDPDALAGWLPSRGRVQVLITTVHREFAGLAEVVDVDLFSADEAVRYLRRRIGPGDDAGARVVADELGHLPLALAQAATVIHRQRLSCSTYVERLRAFAIEQYLRRSPGEPYPRGTAEAILMSLEAAERDDPTGLTGSVVEALSVLSPLGVPRDLLGAVVTRRRARRGPSRWLRRAVPVSAEQVDGVLGVLADASITAFGGADTVIMHRLIARVVRDRALRRGRFVAVIDAAADVLAARRLTSSKAAWAERDRLTTSVQQTDALWAAAWAPAVPQSALRSMVDQLYWLRETQWVLHLVVFCDYGRSAAMAARMLADCARVFGPDHYATTGSRRMLAVAYRLSARSEAALELLETNLRGYERRGAASGAEFRRQLQCRIEWAHTLPPERAAEAVEVFALALRHYEHVRPRRDPERLAARRDLAKAYLSARRFDQAVVLLRHNVADYTHVNGPGSDEVLDARSELAEAYRAAGLIDEAIALLERTAADREAKPDGVMDDLVDVRRELALAYRDAGRHGEAIELLETLVGDYASVRGPDHVLSIDARYHLARGYAEVGRQEQAVALLETVVSDYERTQGPDHVFTVKSRESLAEARRPTRATPA